MTNDLNRRIFLTRAGGAISAVWLSANWPALVSAAEHAHQAAKSATPAKFQFFSPEQAIEIDAIDGNPDWTEMWNGICQDLAATGPAPTEQEKREYAAGFAQGQQLLLTACAA